MSTPSWERDYTNMSWFAGCRKIEACYVEEKREFPAWRWDCKAYPPPALAMVWNGITSVKGYAPDETTARGYCEEWWETFEKRLAALGKEQK